MTTTLRNGIVSLAIPLLAACLKSCHDRHLEDIDACLNRFNTCISRCEI